jgi:hypothetical protein
MAFAGAAGPRPFRRAGASGVTNDGLLHFVQQLSGNPAMIVFCYISAGAQGQTASHG